MAYFNGWRRFCPLLGFGRVAGSKECYPASRPKSSGFRDFVGPKVSLCPTPVLLPGAPGAWAETSEGSDRMSGPGQVLLDRLDLPGIDHVGQEIGSIGRGIIPPREPFQGEHPMNQAVVLDPVDYGLPNRTVRRDTLAPDHRLFQKLSNHAKKTHA